MTDKNVKPKTTKHLEENTGENLCDLEVRQQFTRGDAKSTVRKRKG